MKSDSSFWKSLSDQWDGFWDEVERQPLGYIVFVAILVAGVIISWHGKKQSLLVFVSGWTVAFFAYKRAKAVEQQLQATEKSRSNERFDRLCSMLGGNGETGKIGGLIGLNNLAREQRESYGKNVFGVVCSFIREGKQGIKPPKPIQYAIDIFFKIQKDDNKRYFYEEMELDLVGANLKEMNLKGVQLPNAVLDKVDFSEAQFSSESNFQGASLQKSQILGVKEIRGNFIGCEFQGATLSGSYFEDDAVLDGANFEGAIVYSTNLASAHSMENTIVPSDVFAGLKDKYKNIKKMEKPS